MRLHCLAVNRLIALIKAEQLSDLKEFRNYLLDLLKFINKCFVIKLYEAKKTTPMLVEGNCEGVLFLAVKLL